MTFKPCLRNWLAYLPMVVVLPVPFTPTISTTCGFFAGSMTSGWATGASTFSTSWARIARTSSEVMSLL